MVPIFISEAIPVIVIFKILLLKLIIAIVSGFLVDILFTRFIKSSTKEGIALDICKGENCKCHDKGVIKSALKHTFNISLYILIITIIIDFLIFIIGENNIEQLIQNNLYIGPIITSLIGLIPNCVSSVIITNLYVENVINISSLISGLLTGAGVGIILLFKLNKGFIKENISIVGIIYVVGVISGWVLQFLNFSLNK